MIDPELKYCPQCNDEYMAHADKCASCNKDLVFGLILIERQQAKEKAQPGRGGELTDSDDLVIVHSGQMVDLKHLQDLFNKEKITSKIVGDDSSCGKGCCPSNYFLQIRREDAPEAMHIIKREHQRLTGLDDHDVSYVDQAFDENADEVTCPACGHSFPPTDSTCPDCGLCFG